MKPGGRLERLGLGAGGWRSIIHAEFLLSHTVRPVIWVAAVVAALAAASMYNEFIAAMFVAAYSLVYALTAASQAATAYVDEASSGRAQVYLAAGLSRGEYARSWILAAVAYPAAAVAVSVLLPLAVLNPRSLVEPVIAPFNQASGPGLGLSRGLTLALALAATTLQLGALTMATAALTGRRGPTVFTALFSTLLLPIIIIVVIATLAPEEPSDYIAAASMVLAAFNILEALLLASTVSTAGAVAGVNPVWLMAAISMASSITAIAAAYRGIARREY